MRIAVAEVLIGQPFLRVDPRPNRPVMSPETGMRALLTLFSWTRAALRRRATASAKQVPYSKYALLLVLPGWLLIGCCPKTPTRPWPDPEGMRAQRALIERSFAGTDVQSDARAMTEFRKGQRDSVSAAWWGFDQNDATHSLQACLDSGANVVLIPAMGRPWVTTTLFPRSHTTIILQEGTEVIAKKGAFLGKGDALFCLKDVEDVTLQGYGARLAMRKSDYLAKPYEKSEWRHAIELYGCARISVLGLKVESSGGDGVYLGRGGSRTFNDHIVLRDLLLRDHHRQGISVISAQDLLIENVEMYLAWGTLPCAGIDFEPNNADERLIGCVLKNCSIRCNAGAGIQVYLDKLNASSRPIDIRVEDSLVSNFPAALMVFGVGAVQGKIDFLHTRLSGAKLIGPGSGVKVTCK
jgi:hypothetical protein